MLHLDMMKEAFLSRFVSYFTDGQDKYKDVHLHLKTYSWLGVRKTSIRERLSYQIPNYQW